MGYCQVGGNTQQCAPEECEEVGGSHFDEKKDGCLLLSVLGDERAILLTATQIYPALIEFRERVLPRTPLGRHLLGYFDEFYDEAKDIARSDPELVTDIVWVTTYVSPFVQSMLGQKPYTGSPAETPIGIYATEFRPSAHRALVGVIEKFKAKGSREFVAALEDFERTLSRFVGLGPSEALRELRRAEDEPALRY
jgi:hypothetical protein